MFTQPTAEQNPIISNLNDYISSSSAFSDISQVRLSLHGVFRPPPNPPSESCVLSLMVQDEEKLRTQVGELFVCKGPFEAVCPSLITMLLFNDANV